MDVDVDVDVDEDEDVGASEDERAVVETGQDDVGVSANVSEGEDGRVSVEPEKR